jgi:acyl carrier protein
MSLESDPLAIETRLRDFIAHDLLFSPDGYPYGDATSFLQEGVIDSLGVMELVDFVQKTWALTVAQQDVTPANFDSIERLAAYVRRKQTASVR